MRVNVLCKTEMLKAYFCQQNEVNCVLNAFWKTLRMLLSISETEFCKKSQKFNFSYLAFTQKCFQAIRLYNLKVGKNLYCTLNPSFWSQYGKPRFQLWHMLFFKWNVTAQSWCGRTIYWTKTLWRSYNHSGNLNNTHMNKGKHLNKEILLA